MCFYKTKESKVLVAKRNIKVYKIGAYAESDSFNPFYYDDFTYPVNQIVFTEVKFTDTINWGFHSYINCELVSSYNNVNLYSCGKLILWLSLLTNTVYLGEFTIPKGATYCLNRYGEVVSDKLMYTGNYVKITSNKIYNSKELWKEKIGEIFTYKGKTYQVVKAATCIECAFREKVCSLLKSYIGQCTPSTRSDKTSVIFKEINNMKIKNNQLTIDIPEGYEIDKKNSTFECIKFKPIKKYLTYKEIAEKLNKDICFFIAKGEIQSYTQYASYDNPGVANSYRQIEKILAINQLMNIAKYYNGDWKPDFGNKLTYKYVIQYDGIENTHYNVDYDVCLNRCCVYFKNQEDAQAVIDNPNFMSILDTIYKD